MEKFYLVFVLLFLTLVISIITAPIATAKKNEKPVYVYVDKLPKWANYAGNVMYDSTKAWEKANPGLKFYQVSTPQKADFTVKWVKEFGGEYFGYAYGRQFIEVGLGDSNCNEQWHPFSANYINHIMEHEIGHILGLEHTSDPNDLMYPTALWFQYGLVEEQFTLTSGYAQFIPICTSRDVTSYDYSVSGSDKKYGFDVYFVPSIDEFEKWTDGEQFSYYSTKGCYGENYVIYSGSCKGISQESGLLVIMHGDTTRSSLTQIKVKMLEK